MSLSQWLRPPRRSLTAFVAMTVALGGVLGWLAWRLVLQDRGLERQRTSEQLERAVELVVIELRSRLADAERQLAAVAAKPEMRLPGPAVQLAASLADDAVIVVFQPDAVSVFPDRLLPFLPNPAEVDVAPVPARFGKAELLEFREGQPAAAAGIYARIAREESGDRRLQALIREAAARRNAGEGAAALRIYESLLGEVGVINGVPVELLARHARCTTLEELGQQGPLIQEAQALQRALTSPRSPLSRPTYAFYLSEVQRWLAASRPEPKSAAAGRAALASAVDTVWEDWRRDPAGTGRQPRTLAIGTDIMVLIAHPGAERFVGVLLGPASAERALLGGIRRSTSRLGVQFSLVDDRGRPWSGPAIGQNDTRAVRAASEAGLPWTVYTTPGPGFGTDPSSHSRRRLMLAGAFVVGTCVAIGVYFSTRAVHRELEIARLKSDFVAAVSHDFRTPLASFRQLSELLLDDRVTSDGDRKEYYRRMYRESGRLQRLVEELLDFARIDAGAREYRLECVDPTPIVRSIAAEFEAERLDGPVAVDVDVQERLPNVRVDREAFGRALWNLLDNASKYSPGRDRVRVSTRASDGRVFFSVSDDGIGVSREHQQDIFGKFVRVTSDGTHAVSGTGLGLAIVKHVVDGHGGRVTLVSEPGHGSTFTIELPAAGLS